jgi:hypothetical protein
MSTYIYTATVTIASDNCQWIPKMFEWSMFEALIAQPTDDSHRKCARCLRQSDSGCPDGAAYFDILVAFDTAFSQLCQ